MKNTRVWKIIIIIGVLLEMADWWIFDIPVLGIIGGIGLTIGIFMQTIYSYEQSSEKQPSKNVFKNKAGDGDLTKVDPES